MRIYLAGALFTKAEQDFNLKLSELLSYGWDVFLPQKACEHLTDPLHIADTCRMGIMSCEVVVAILEGTDVDSGTAWECGYATGIGKPVIGIRTDFRQRGDDKGLNCMLSQNIVELITCSDINDIVTELYRIFKEMGLCQ